MNKIEIKFEIAEKNWLEYDQDIVSNIDNFLKNAIGQTDLKKISDKNIKIEISILLTNNSQIRKLNKNYRQKDKATNILAFPLYNIKLQKDQNHIKQHLFDNNLILGDLVLSLEYLQNEADEQNKNIDHHLKHLLLHGLLHLIGYDHIKDSDREQMERIEIQILEKFDIKDPYN